MSDDKEVNSFIDGHLEDAASREYDDSKEHPTPEQLMIKVALEQLTPKQRKIWELFAYDQLTQDEIAKKLNISQKRVSITLKAVETKVTKWCKLNRGAYMLLKMEQKINDE